MTQHVLQPDTTTFEVLPATGIASVGIVGLGYVGLPTAIDIAASGVPVVGVDIDLVRLAAIDRLDVDLDDRDRTNLAGVLADGRVTTTDDATVLAGVDGIIICVPTPVDSHLTPDLKALRGACEAVVRVARPGQVIVLTSTSYVGTTADLLVAPLEARGLRVGTDVFVAFSPERIDPGTSPLAHDRVPRVVGGVTDECTRRAAQLVGLGTVHVHEVTSPEAAELTKLYENMFRAVNIALVNELADVSRVLGVHVTEVIDAAATKPYGFMPFAPGPGVGGHCIPCDPHYLLWQLRAKQLSMPVVESAMQEIAARPAHVVERVRDQLADRGRPVRGARIVVVGVAYKGGVADIRESPALEILSRLAGSGADVCYVDPLVPRLVLDGRVLAAVSPDELEVDLAVLHTRHPGQDLGWLQRVPVVLDATYRAVDVPHRVAV